MKILIVDDEPVSLKKMEKILSAYGECDTAENGEEAINHFKKAIEEEKPYALVSLDIELPDLKGTDVLKQFREIEKQKGIDKAEQTKIMMVTASKTKKTVLESIKSGCNDYVAKPFDRDVVITKLKNMGFKPET